MDHKNELAIEATARQNNEIEELTDVQLDTVGGGIGETVLVKGA